MEYVSLEDLKESDIQSLVDNKVVENRKIEYKRELSLNRDKEKKEFLADISSFANATGGDIIIGVDADSETGEPTEINGMEAGLIDAEILKVENLIRTGIRPRVWGVKTQAVSVSDSRKVLVIRVPNSWTSPHRVEYQGHEKFYTRGSNGKYPMDVDELRTAFNLSQTISDKIKSFRIERINNIYTNQSYLPLQEGAKVVLHIIPFSAYSQNNTFDFQNVKKFTSEMRPMLGTAWDYQFNLDGFMCYGPFGGYTQVFKNGIIEAVNISMLQETMGQKIIPSASLEAMVIESFNSYKRILVAQNVSLPVIVTLSLTGIKDHEFGAGHYYPRFGNKFSHGKDVLNLSESLIQDFSMDSSKILRPIFDSLWNAYGHEKSKNYNEDGVWKSS